MSFYNQTGDVAIHADPGGRRARRASTTWPAARPMAWATDGELHLPARATPATSSAGSEWAHVVHGHLGRTAAARWTWRRSGCWPRSSSRGRATACSPPRTTCPRAASPVALVEMALRSGDRRPAAGCPTALDPFVFLLSESAARAVVAVPRSEELRFTEMCAARGFPATRIGVVDSGIGAESGLGARRRWWWTASWRVAGARADALQEARPPRRYPARLDWRLIRVRAGPLARAAPGAVHGSRGLARDAGAVHAPRTDEASRRPLPRWPTSMHRPARGLSSSALRVRPTVVGAGQDLPAGVPRRRAIDDRAPALRAVDVMPNGRGRCSTCRATEVPYDPGGLMRCPAPRSSTRCPPASAAAGRRYVVSRRATRRPAPPDERLDRRTARGRRAVTPASRPPAAPGRQRTVVSDVQELPPWTALRTLAALRVAGDRQSTPGWASPRRRPGH